MATLPMILIVFAILYCGVNAVPIVIKESSPNGQSVISISSSDPEVEKYILDYAAEHAKRRNQSPAAGGRGHTQGTVVQSYSVTTPEKTIVGTGRSFGDDFTDPFFAPYFVAPNLEGFDIRTWLRNLDSIYEPRYTSGNPGYTPRGTSVSATAVSNNGQVYGQVETRNLDRP